MNMSLKKLAIAAAFVATAGAAQAVVSPVLTINSGESVTYAGWTVSNARGTGTLAFDRTLTGALNLAAIQMSAIAPATLNAPLNSSGKYASIAASSIITSGSGIFDTDTQILTVVGVGSAGGAKLTAVDDTETSGTSTGGFLSIQNISADLTTKTIFADVTGANGVASQRLAMWNYSALTGQTAFPAVEGTTRSLNTVTGLTITSTAFEYFAQALGLTDFGKTAMGGIKNYGTFSTDISMDVVRAVPEPSTYALMGLGLVGIAFAARRRAA
jgi:PEP-CTERM motif